MMIGYSGDEMNAAAVVVTFNRKELLIECVRALLNQSMPIDMIYIVDNASTDGTRELLGVTDLLAHPKVCYTHLETNTGGAGGFHVGTRLAFDAGFEWLWLMDDDAEPQPEALARLNDFSAEKNVVALASNVIGADTLPQLHHRGWFNWDSKEGLIRPINAEDACNEVLEVGMASFVGILISRYAIEKIGLPKAEFFIHYDDAEYCYRLATVGRILFVRDSVIVHKDAAKNGMSLEKGVFSRVSERIPYDRLWITYFGYRNSIWMRFNVSSMLAIRFVSMTLSRKIVGVIFYDDHKIARLKFWCSAAWDGLRGRFDNRKPKLIVGER
ncbi:glycosyltransferase family 2 protein [Paraburkholderia sp. GAS32]|uniref:glycosyltransferase family 2 protein n=1 Tax=Paraburkholderia sp. GAS32 TaxID=3035129 RepID=UPI003D1988D1